jgi:Zn-dependent protease with chaperone function
MRRCVTKFLLAGLGWPLLITPALVVASTIAVTPVEQYLEAATASEHARSRLFELSRLLTPLCRTPLVWSLGVPPVMLFQDASKSEYAAKVSTQLMRDLGGQAGEKIFASEQYKTPYAAAGVRRGDRVLANEFEMSLGADTGSDAQRREAERRSLQAQPERAITVKRGQSELPMLVQAVPTCDISLRVVNSQFAYANNYANDVNASVLVTLPLLAGLNDAELTMVLAHEAAQSMLGVRGSTPVAMKALAVLVPYAGFQLRDLLWKNTELDVLAPSSEDLIEADRLTVLMLKHFGIGADAYLRFQQKMHEVERAGSEPAYRVTRPLTGRRQADLQAQVLRTVTGEPLRMPQSIDADRLAALDTLGQSLLRAELLTAATQEALRASAAAPARAVVAASNKAHRQRVPAATGYARLDDLAAIPVREEGRLRFRHYLSLQSPKAFVVYASGGWRFFWNDPNAMTSALEHCAREGKTCWLYAVDDQIVFDADPAKRISHSGQLKTD